MRWMQGLTVQCAMPVGMQWINAMRMQRKCEVYKKENRDPSWWVCNGLSVGMQCNVMG